MIGPDTRRDILDAIPEEARGVFLAMALLCIRPSEAVVMSARQLRGDTSRADRTLGSGVKPTKNEEPTTLPLPDELAHWLDRWVPKEARLRGELLFKNPEPAAHGARRRCADSGIRRARRWASL